MKTYRAGMAPSGMKDAPEVRAVAQYAQMEFQSIAQAAQRAEPSVTWEYLHAEPVRYAAGDVVLADGTDWDPGSGAGLYRRNEDNSAWVFAGNNTTDLAASLHAATAKTVLVDADEVNGTDSAASWGLIRTTWANVKVFFKTYFDTIYQALLVSGTNIKTINGASVLGSGDLAVSAGAAGSNKHVQFNDGGAALGGSAKFTFDKTAGEVDITNGALYVYGTDTTRGDCGSFHQYWDNVAVDYYTLFVSADITGSNYGADSTLIYASSTYGTLRVDALCNLLMNGGYVQAKKITAPSAPPTDYGRIYFDDNGAGKMRLMVRFPSGAAQQVAIEP